MRFARIILGSLIGGYLLAGLGLGLAHLVAVTSVDAQGLAINLIFGAAGLLIAAFVPAKGNRGTGLIAAGCLVLALAALTWSQVGVFRNALTGEAREQIPEHDRVSMDLVADQQSRDAAWLTGIGLGVIAFGAVARALGRNENESTKVA